MVTLRKVTLAVVLAASVAVLAMAVFLFWNLGQGPFPDEQTGDLELLIAILLSSCGLYAIVFALSSYLNTMSFARQADRSIAAIREQLAVVVSELRALKEEARKAPPASQPQPEIAREVPPPVRRVSRDQEAQPNVEAQVDAIVRKIAKWNGAALDSQSKLELGHYESAAAYLELIGGAQAGASLPRLYRHFAELHAPGDKARQRFYLGRALSLASPDSQTASEIHYELACWFADNRDFSPALGELTLAFQHQSKALDDRLALDLDEGGRLYQLASTPPFEKALNDLLLNMSIGIG
jgi:type II secretory pathway component PulJ